MFKFHYLNPITSTGQWCIWLYYQMWTQQDETHSPIYFPSSDFTDVGLPHSDNSSYWMDTVSDLH